MRPGEVGNAPVAPRQVRQNLPPRWISQRGESSVQRSRRILNHLVNYLAEALESANIFSDNMQKLPDWPSRSPDRIYMMPSAVHFNVEAFVSNAFHAGTWHKRRYNNIYEFDRVNASLFTTYGILVGSPP